MCMADETALLTEDRALLDVRETDFASNIYGIMPISGADKGSR